VCNDSPSPLVSSCKLAPDELRPIPCSLQCPRVLKGPTVIIAGRLYKVGSKLATSLKLVGTRPWLCVLWLFFLMASAVLFAFYVVQAT
jgi:hypothetical protein